LNRSILLLALLPLLASSETARSANSYDACTGFITTLPAAITTQGTWCLDKDLSYNPTSGAAITVGTNNVTIDCNGFKLGGLAGGAGTMALGVSSTGRQNTSVRGCNIRGFLAGVVIEGIGSGHLVEDNRFDGNRFAGILVQGEGMQVQRNRVYDTGAAATPSHAIGIGVTGGSGDVRDNLVYNVGATPGAGNDAAGILVQGLDFGRIAGNSVRYVAADTGGTAYGIGAESALHLVVDGNHVATVGELGADSVGIACDSTGALVRDNFIQGFTTALGALCQDEGRNSVVVE
jgi:hypothetical protein